MNLDGPCPECGADWTGEPIQQEYIDAGYYESGRTHYSRLIGIELSYDHPKHYDGVSFWRCPDCSAVWDRFTGELTLVGVFA